MHSSPEVTLTDKLTFLRETRHAFGRTALVLSGGGALGAFHVVRSWPPLHSCLSWQILHARFSFIFEIGKLAQGKSKSSSKRAAEPLFGCLGLRVVTQASFDLAGSGEGLVPAGSSAKGHFWQQCWINW